MGPQRQSRIGEKVKTFKERLVAKGSAWKNCINYEETLSPIGKLNIFKSIYPLQLIWAIDVGNECDYVKLTFLEGLIE